MSGIDKIIRQIESDTKDYCDEIIENAQIKADAVIAQTEKEADEIRTSSAAKIEQKLSDINARAKSSAALEEKKAFLSAKQRVICDMLSAALSNAKDLSDDEYFSLILKMIENHSQDDRGVICFGEKDLGRLPQGFEKQINDVSKGALVISKDPIDIDAGFVLSYGGIEENCSFDAIYRSKAEVLSDRASSLLF
ncbi:MAG: V-type ATP synthase subunit E [Ruminococcus sp.]|nr:V-type ATP synthase subunit E [Ruminococcus sp.]